MGRVAGLIPFELVGDIARIFDEAITNIDDVNSRDERNR